MSGSTNIIECLALLVAAGGDGGMKHIPPTAELNIATQVTSHTNLKFVDFTFKIGNERLTSTK